MNLLNPEYILIKSLGLLVRQDFRYVLKPARRVGRPSGASDLAAPLSVGAPGPPYRLKHSEALATRQDAQSGPYQCNRASAATWKARYIDAAAFPINAPGSTAAW